jgi:glycosyltransferase involved in cell wall biosynthesis
MSEGTVGDHMNLLSHPSVSVLVAAWNEARLIERCLDSLLAIDWPELEIVVCAGGNDITYDLALQYASDQIIVLEQRPGEGKQAALRKCFAESRGEIIYFTDADCLVNEQSIRAVISPILSGEFLAATGHSVPLPEQESNNLVRFQWARDANWVDKRGAIANRDTKTIRR